MVRKSGFSSRTALGYVSGGGRNLQIQHNDWYLEPHAVLSGTGTSPLRIQKHEFNSLTHGRSGESSIKASLTRMSKQNELNKKIHRLT